ncbi:MAG: hypothetical protein H6666_17650 [Ardenticatenaceae bacterium]|nr:hypothetical protein [Ardenticatenaceae bacterium]
MRRDPIPRPDVNDARPGSFLRRRLGWNRASYVLLSTFLLVIFLLAYVWWPLAEEYLAQIDWQGPWWRQLDWLLVGIFLFMTLVLMAGADLRADGRIVLVGLVGGLVIESWGTQTELWTYYTLERPPLWIIPAWPIASLTIDRLVRYASRRTAGHPPAGYRLLYWLIFPAFYGLMLSFVWPTLDKSFTLIALALCLFLLATPTDYRLAVLTFAAGSGLGYFLELWGTTRLCWTYYTLQTPPLFAVLAHGMAAVAFWRAALLLSMVLAALRRRWPWPVAGLRDPL